jgi:uncharacterized linocin/CFP29 family protein
LFWSLNKKDIETPMNTQVDWTNEQWSRIKQVVLDEATKASVGGSFLPCCGPLERSATVVRAEKLTDDLQIRVDDVDTIKLCTLTVLVQLKHQQLAEENLTGAFSAFRRAANLLARAEDAIVFNGLRINSPGTELTALHVPPQCTITGGQELQGLVRAGLPVPPEAVPPAPPEAVPPAPPEAVPPAPPEFLVREPYGENLVPAVASAIAALENNGHYGPFACVLGNAAFVAAHTPSPSSLVLPRDRMEPLLGTSLLRSSVLNPKQITIVGLAGDPIDLVVATPPTVQFLNVTDEAKYLFRVYEKFVLRIKEEGAVKSFSLA